MKLILAALILIPTAAFAQTAWTQSGYVNGQPTTETPATVPLMMLHSMPPCMALAQAGDATPDDKKNTLCVKP